MVNLFLLAGPDAPDVEELMSLPEGMSIVGTGRPRKECAGWTDQQWAQVAIVFREGTGKTAATKEELQKVWPKLTGLKWLHSNLAGIESLMIPELLNSSVTVTNCKGAYNQSLAEWAIAACCWFAKDLPRLLAQKADRKWEPYYVEELRGKTLGIVGFGGIGQETAHIARAFKMKIIALRRQTQLSEENSQPHLKVYSPDKFHALMAESDYVVAAMPFTPATHKLIDAEAICCMKRTGVLINVGRGQTIDEIALIKALQERRIRGAGLDVTYAEPLPQDSPLWELDNVLLSPHSAVRGETIFTAPKQQFDELAKLFMQGKELFNIVDVKAGY